MKCPLCQHEFETSAAQAVCRNCPMARACRGVCCPNCGYEMPAESRLARWLRRPHFWRARAGRESHGTE